MGEERLTGPEDLDGSGASVARARARQMRRRLPLFAAVWLGVAVGWSIVLCLESLLTPLLDISRIAAGKVSLQLEAVDLAAILAARAEVARAAATVSGITLDVRLDAMPGPVRGDPARLNQVFENLLSNAIKFTPGGGHITLALERADGPAQVTVSDTGIGIPAHVLPHVFDQFQQADSSIPRRYGGLGLGLAIARRLVEMHGGSIEVESGGAP